MSTQHIVTAAFVKVSIGSPTGNRVAALLHRGDVVPTGVVEDQLERLVDRGLIEAEEIEDAQESAAEEENEVEAYAGVNVADLKAEIAKRNEGREDDKKIVPAEPGNRPELVASLVADDAE